MSERIYTRCPACHKDTLTINDDRHLLCTWIYCPDPTAIDRMGEQEPEQPPSNPVGPGVSQVVCEICHRSEDQHDHYSRSKVCRSPYSGVYTPRQPTEPPSEKRYQPKMILDRCDECDPSFAECWNNGNKCRKQPAEAVSEAAREAASELQRRARYEEDLLTDGEVKQIIQRAITDAGPGQQAEIAALRKEVERLGDLRREVARRLDDAGVHGQPDEMGGPIVETLRISLLVNERDALRAELATTRERLAKCEAQVAALEGTIERLGKGRSDDSDEIQSQRRTIQSYSRCAEAQETALKQIRDECDNYVDGAPDAGPLANLANRIDVIASRALEGQSTP